MNRASLDRVFEVIDQNPAILIGTGLALVALALAARLSKCRPDSKVADDPLDQALFWWTERNPFRMHAPHAQPYYPGGG